MKQSALSIDTIGRIATPYDLWAYVRLVERAESEATIPNDIKELRSITGMRPKELSRSLANLARLDLIHIEGDYIRLPEHGASKLECIQPKKPIIDIMEVCRIFNDRMRDRRIPSVRSISKARRAAVEARCRKYGCDAIYAAIEKAATSDFLNGDNNTGFTATFDWIFRPNNFIKVIEGNYDNRQPRAYNNRTDDESARHNNFVDFINRKLGCAT